jgi:SsrA-binding protein
MANAISMAVEIKNKKANYQYELTERFTAGIQLKGTEIKSIRGGKASIGEAYCKLINKELFVFNMYIAEYENAGYATHEERRQRKLLLDKVELKKITRKMKDVGLTIVPTLVFINDNGWAKMNIAIAKGKKMHDKRDDLKKKDVKRDIDRGMTE